ncbi:MAG TPA: FHA domain-containing protein [Croceibacterium sp.]
MSELETETEAWGPRSKPGRRPSKPPPDEPIELVDVALDPDRPIGPAEVPSEDLEMCDAVVGWVVIVDGPGKGADFKLVSGINSVGRGDGASVDLEFGDGGIGGGAHCRITFDPRGRSFYLSPGEGRRIAYSNDRPVLAVLELEPLQDIVLGSTTLRFVPLCSKEFNWS